MNKFKIILIFIIIAATVGVIVSIPFTSKKEVKISVTTPSELYFSGINPQEELRETIQTIKNTQTVSLSDGYYCLQAIDKKYSKTPQCFTVFAKDMPVTSDPNYSTEFLTRELSPQQQDINKVIAARYARIIDNYTICSGSLFKKGNWYGAVLLQKSLSANENNDAYYIVLKKVDNTWSVAATPATVLSRVTITDIPSDVLTETNHLIPCNPDGFLTQPLPDDSVF